MTKKPYDISVKNFSYDYPDGTRALSKISLLVSTGESIAILGPNGAGKSTLLLALAGLIFGHGEVSICGVPLSKKTVRFARQKVGIVFQNPEDQLFCPTVGQDVAFGPRNMGLGPQEIKHRVKKALSDLGIAKLYGRSAHHLSFGEKKKASIATILSMDPEVVAFDEPTANLDPEGVHELKRVIKGIGKTKLIITHDISLAAELTDRAIVINKGGIVCDMPMKALIGDVEKLRELKLFYD